MVRLDCFPHISHTCKKRWPRIFTLPYINPSTAGNPNFPSYIYPSPYPSLTVCLVPFPPPSSSSPSRHPAERECEAAFPKHQPHSTPATQKKTSSISGIQLHLQLAYPASLCDISSQDAKHQIHPDSSRADGPRQCPDATLPLTNHAFMNASQIPSKHRSNRFLPSLLGSITTFRLSG